MGTRCDFYAGRGEQAVYLGSIACDADVYSMAEHFSEVSDRRSFDIALAGVFAKHGEIPACKGWPWPWRDSGTTDTVIAFDDNQVWCAHHSGHWSLLSAYDEPSQAPCEFPDMLASEEATAEGRLRLALRFGAELAVGPNEDVLLKLLYRVTLDLAAAYLHVFEQDGAYRVMHNYGSSSKWDAVAEMAQLLRKHSEFDELLAQRQEMTGEQEWSLLSWLKASGGLLDYEEVQLEITPTQPLFFGQAVPEHAWGEVKGSFVFYQAKNTEQLREGMRLLQLMLDRGPYAFAYPVAKSLLHLGAFPVRQQDADEWLCSPQPDFEGLTMEQMCKTHEGRQRVKRWANERVFSR